MGDIGRENAGACFYERSRTVCGQLLVHCPLDSPCTPQDPQLRTLPSVPKRCPDLMFSSALSSQCIRTPQTVVNHGHAEWRPDQTVTNTDPVASPIAVEVRALRDPDSLRSARDAPARPCTVHGTCRYESCARSWHHGKRAGHGHGRGHDSCARSWPCERQVHLTRA